MRNPLNKRLPRDIRRNLGKYLSIFILLTATIAFGSSFLVVSDSIQSTLLNNQKENHVENGNFGSYLELDDKTIEKVEELDVQIDKNYYIDVKQNYTLRIYENRNKINIPSIFEGKIPNNENEIALDRLFAQTNEIKINDIIKIDENNLKVVGFISLPNYNSLFKSNNDMVMDTKGFGVSIVNQETFENLQEDYNTKYNYSYYFNNQELNKDERIKLSNKVKDCLIENTIITDLTMAENNQAISFLANDMGSDIPTMKALIYVVIIIMAFVFVILSNNTIEQEANIIGTLRASGYKKSEILSHYIKLPVLITFISAIIGNILGYTVLIEPFKQIYYKSYCLSPFDMKWNAEAFIITTVIPVLIMIVVNYLMLKKKLSLSPLDFLRRNLKKGKNKKAKKLPEKLSLKKRFQLRIVLQNISSYVILFIGIYLASFILMFAIGFMPLLDNYTNTINETFPSEYQYILKAPIEVENEKAEKITTYSLDTYYKMGDKDVDITFLGIDEDSKYYKNIKLYNKDEGIVISDSLSKKLDIKIGDEITFTDKYSSKEYKLKVKDIYNYRASFTVFMKQQDLNKMLEQEDEYYNSYLSNEELDIDKTYVVSTITKEDIANVANQMLVSFDELLKMVMLFAIAIYLVLMYVLTKVIIDKNALNISLMKIFGYKEKEVRKFYLNSTTFTVILSLIACIPLETLSFKFIMLYAFSMIEGYLEFYLPIYVYIQIIVIGIISYLLINALHVRKVKKIKMNDALKNRE